MGSTRAREWLSRRLSPSMKRPEPNPAAMESPNIVSQRWGDPSSKTRPAEERERMSRERVVETIPKTGERTGVIYSSAPILRGKATGFTPLPAISSSRGILHAPWDAETLLLAEAIYPADHVPKPTFAGAWKPCLDMRSTAAISWLGESPCYLASALVLLRRSSQTRLFRRRMPRP